VGAFAVAGVLSLLALPAWLRRQEDGRELLALSIGAGASLLIVYHRFYDAAILLIPLVWVFWSLASVEGRRFGWTRWAVLLGLLPFFVPGAAALYTLERSGRLPERLTGNVLWEVFVLHHQTWALVWLVLALGGALGRCPARVGPAFAWGKPKAE
jgi:hypothetical protein